MIAPSVFSTPSGSSQLLSLVKARTSYQGTLEEIQLQSYVRHSLQNLLHPDHRDRLVVLHTHPGLLLHRQPRGLPHRPTDEVAHQLGRRSPGTVRSQVRSHAGRIHNEAFQGINIIEEETE